MSKSKVSARAASAKLSDEITPTSLAIAEPPSPLAAADPEIAPFEIRAVEPETVAIEALKRDPALICRAAGINKRTVGEYAEALKAGATFPPVVVFTDAKGSSWLADGFHRTAAAALAGLTEIAADVRHGSRKDALIFAANANSQHGLRRTTADKRRAVLLVLDAYAKWSDRKIGEACGVDNKTVAAARRSLGAAGEEIPHAEGEDASGEEIPHAAILDRLARSIGRLFAKCPDESRSELRARLDGLFAAAALSDGTANVAEGGAS